MFPKDGWDELSEAQQRDSYEQAISENVTLREENKRLREELNEWQRQVCGQGDVIFLLRERLYKYEQDKMPFEWQKE